MLSRFLPIGYIAAIGLSCASGRTHEVSPSFVADSAQALEAAMVLQGVDDENFVADSAIQVVALALHTIRSTYPEVRNVRAPGGPEFELRLDSAMAKGLCSAPVRGGPPPKPVQDFVEHTGLPSVDSLNHTLGVLKSHVQMCFGRWILVFPIYPHFPNIPALAKLYAPLPGVRGAGEPEYVSVGGGPDEVQLEAEPHSLRFLFVEPSHSCCSVRRYEFRYWPGAGRVEKLPRNGGSPS